MNSITRARHFVESLRTLSQRTARDWRCCPYCGQTETHKHGTYTRRPWTLQGRQTVAVARHYCRRCRRTYSETSAEWVRKGWYTRPVRRMALDQWQHTGTSLRRTAEWVRSLVGQQERWLRWHPWGEREAGREVCPLGASSVHRWLDQAGARAEQTVPEQLASVASSGVLGADGLWARLRAGGQRVVLALSDSVSGLLYPPVVVAGEGEATAWQQLFTCAATAGLDLSGLRGITSDGAQGLGAYLREHLRGVNSQRCVWHVWRQLGGELARAVARAVKGLPPEAWAEARRQVRQELGELLGQVLNAPHAERAEEALARLQAHAQGGGLARQLNELLDRLFVYQLPEQRGLGRVGPEWLWRDFRLRLSRGRNAGSEERLARMALVWALYHNFTPAQVRQEVKRRYPRAGQSPLELAGVPPAGLSYLDALEV
jgi:transposase-like protein